MDSTEAHNFESLKLNIFHENGNYLIYFRQINILYLKQLYISIL